MKKSELKEYIREAILAELAEVTMVGPKTEPTDVEDIVKQERTDRSTVQAAIQKAKTTNQPVGVAESEEEPTEAEIRKEKSLAKAQTEYTKLTKELKELEENMLNTLEKYKNAADNDKKQKLLDQLKKLTGEKKELKAKINRLKTIKI